MRAARRRSVARAARAACVLAVLATASGCAGVLLGSAAGGAVVANDPRTTGTFVEDQAIEIKALALLADDPLLREQTHIAVTSYNQVVLLCGQARTEALRQAVVARVRGIAKIRHIHDEISLAAPSSLATRSHDSLLTTRVKTRLLGAEALRAARVKVVSESGVVYLMGLLTPAAAQAAADVASATEGVARVVKLFESP